MKLVFALLFSLAGIAATAQQKPTDLDKSPLDVSYAPQNYPILRMNGKVADQPNARVIYSRPLKNGRRIFGDIVRYNEIWRMGANEATEIEFFRPVKIGGKPVAKGRYTMYAICSENKWTIAINSEKDYWGLIQNPKKDVVRVDVPVQKIDDDVEALTIYFEDVKGGANLIVMWDNAKAIMPISY
ncbi:MAG: DUF2911 domain-containing protein [Filimonas sp.]|nr:DUF2911 domain-containing protein [Filimonas sp.]